MPPEAFVRFKKKAERLAALANEEGFPCPVCGQKPSFLEPSRRWDYAIGCNNKKCKAYGFMVIEGDNAKALISEWNEKVDCEKVCVSIDGQKLFIRGCYECPFKTRLPSEEWGCSYPWKPKSCEHVYMPEDMREISPVCPLREDVKEIYRKELDGLA